MRDVEAPTTRPDGEETHPAWAMVAANRVTCSAPGAVLFDSDIRHQHYVTVRLSPRRT